MYFIIGLSCKSNIFVIYMQTFTNFLQKKLHTLRACKERGAYFAQALHPLRWLKTCLLSSKTYIADNTPIKEKQTLPNLFGSTK